jgi:hypothetical protein
MMRASSAFAFSLLFVSQSGFALTSSQLSKCVKSEIAALRTKSLVNMTELEQKVLGDPASLRSFVDDSAEASSRDANPIARTLMKESATCQELADKWAVKSDGPRPTVDQIVEILSERGATVKPEDVQDRVLKPALKSINVKIAENFTLQKNPGLAMLAAMYLTSDGTIVFPDSPKVPAREKKVAEQIKKAQSADEAESIIVADTKTALADELESKLKAALKHL